MSRKITLLCRRFKLSFPFKGKAGIRIGFFIAAYPIPATAYSSVVGH